MPTSPTEADEGANEGPRGEATGHERVPPARRTLPPPEWLGRDGPRSAASLTLERYQLEAPVARRTGPRAELAALAARLEASAGDDAEERAAAEALGRALAARGTELDVATRLARRALLLGEEPALREELAGWFASLGEPALAAASLRPLAEGKSGPEVAALLSRVGILLARAGEGRAASDALLEAAEHDPNDAVVCEIRASIAAWSSGAVTHEQAAEAYLMAAERREAQGDRAGAFENSMRAFESSPDHSVAAERLVEALVARGRYGAADEARREHATALGAAGRAVHVRRMRQAVRDGDLPRALGAAFDARLDAEVDLRSVLAAIDPLDGAEDGAPLGIDSLLERTNLHELLAVRVELASEYLAGRERSRARAALGRLLSGPLSRPDRAVEAWIDALVADPGSQEAFEALRRHATLTRDEAPLIEALIRVGRSRAEGARKERAACLRELLSLSEERLGDPGLALWAVQRLKQLIPDAAELSAIEERLAAREKLQNEALTAARAELALVSGSDRLPPLMRVANILQGRPDAAQAYLEILYELVDRLPDERSHQVAVERTLRREGAADELSAFLERQRERTASPVERARLRFQIATAKRRRGDAEGALADLVPLVDEAGSHPAAWALALVLAAQRDDRRVRARALQRLATQLSATPRAVLTAVAAEELLEAGDVEGARAASELASNADPSLARPAAVRAKVGLTVGGRYGADATERAMSIVVPRASACRALAATYDELGDDLLATAWTQRLVALRPGDLAAARLRLQRATRADDGRRLADTLAWLLSQPQPLATVAGDVAAALSRLLELAPGRAGALARRALDVLGPRHADLRKTVLDVADAGGERGLGISVVERWLATGSLGEDRARVLLELSRRRKEAGDVDGAARALGRAIREGAPAADVLTELDGGLATRSTDGEVALLVARAEALSALPEVEPHRTARAWRELGAALWDLASDQVGALRAWERAMKLDGERGAEAFAADLIAFAGERVALSRLVDHAERLGDTLDAARFYSVAARLALGANRPGEAFAYAARTLEIEPARTEVLAVAERAALPSDVEALDSVYQMLAESALGRYGERSVHYRAARQLERRGELVRALRHAVGAFEAVPSEGLVFVTLARLADRAERRSELVAAIERVAQHAAHPGERSAWLRRAAIFAGTSEEGVRQRVDVLLRALAVRAEVDLIQALGSAMSDLVRLVPDEREIVELRFDRAATAVLKRAEGPEGARLGIELALSALVTFDNPTLALRALDSAIDCDGDIEQFAALSRHVAALSPAAEAFIARVDALSQQKFAGVGVDLLELTAALARERGDRSREAKLLVIAAERDPERGEVVRRAEQAARAAGDQELLARVLSAMPDPERFAALLERSRAAEESGDADAAVESLQQASELGGLDLGARRTLFERSLSLFKRLGRRDELEALLVPELARDDLVPEQVVRMARELAVVHASRGRPEAALDCTFSALARVPDDVGLLADAVTFARQTGEKRSEVQALSRLVELESDPLERLEQRRALAELLESLGDEASALVQWTEIHAQVPINADAIAALERDAERRGDYERVARLLAERASLAQRVDDVRRIRLRRATVLEQRLGRADEARAELEAVLSATGDNLSLLRVLADLDERLGDLMRAAPLWLRASALASDREEAADLAQRSCRAYLEGGDVEAAHRVLEGMQAWVDRDRLLALTVDVERRRENPVGLADALDNLATRSSDMPAHRSELLVESARLALAAGDADRARERAQRAAGIAPSLPEAQLLARYLEYAERGPGSVEQARETVALLRNLGDELDPEQAELRAFLLAEALDVAEGPAAAGAELGKTRTNILDRPLVALALAERLAATGHPLSALDGFALALDGDLRNLRRPARVALRAAETARSGGELDRAEQFLERAIGDAETEARARVLLAEIRDERLLEREALASDPPASERDADPFRAPPPPPLPAGWSTPADIGAVRIVSAQPPSRLPPRFTPSGTPAQSGVELPSLSGTYIPPSRVSGGPISVVTPSRTPSSPDLGAVPQNGERRSSVPSPPPRQPRLSSTSSSTFAAASPEEIALHRELFDGSVEAGLRLLERLEGAADRTHDRVAVSRRLALLSPGEPAALERLAAAARADRNPVYSAAVEHVLALVRPTSAVAEPPPIAETPEQPDAVRALLFRETQSRGLEALSLVWEGASHLFRRDPSAYGITGLERIQASAPTPLAHAYAGASRALGALRTPLFQRRTAGAVSVNLALLIPPAVVLSGDVQRDTPELRFHLGAMLAAASPQFVLLFGTPEAQARSVLHGLTFAFGPPRPNPNQLGPVLNLAELLWEGIPARMQRRLRELCEDAEALDYEVAMLQARIAVRRAGFFVAGDFGVAAREICADEALPTPRLLGPGGLSELIAASPSLRSLYQLAISPEYAETRWRSARTASRGGG